MPRFDRQKGLVDQEKIYNLNIAVIGQQCIAHYLTFCYTGLGVGNIYLVRDDVTLQNPNEFMYFGETVADKARLLGESLKEIYPDMKIIVKDRVNIGGLERIPNLDLIVESTNNPKNKEDCLEFAEEKKIPVISLSSNKYKATMCIYDPKKRYKRAEEKEFYRDIYQNQPQGAITSGFIAGLALEITLKLCIPQEEGNFNIDNPFHYNLLSKTRFDLKEDFETKEDYSGKRILLVGLGAMGTPAGVAISLSAANRENVLDIMDPDITNEQNLNRQMLYSGELGKPKAKILEEKLKKITPALNIRSHYGSIGMLPSDEELAKEAKFFDQNFLIDNNQKKYDLIVGCIDSFPTISFLSRWALEFGIPFINGTSGVTSKERARIATYIPNKTPCIECQFSFRGDAKETILKRKSNREGIPDCPAMIVEETPTLLTPNVIGGLIQAGECFNLLSGIENTDAYLVEYDSSEDFGIRSTKKAKNCSPCNNKCDCHKGLK